MDFVEHTANGKKVFIDTSHSHATLHLEESSNLLRLLREALPHIAPETDEYACTFNFGREVGHSSLVSIDERDDIIFAKRVGRDTYTKFAKNRQSVSTDSIAIILERDEEKEDTYVIWSAWLGTLTPSFPGDDRETVESRAFWESHALVYDQSVIIPGTETKECPW